MISNPIHGKIKNGNQTTNQLPYHDMSIDINCKTMQDPDKRCEWLISWLTPDSSGSFLRTSSIGAPYPETTCQQNHQLWLWSGKQWTNSIQKHPIHNIPIYSTIQKDFRALHHLHTISYHWYCTTPSARNHFDVWFPSYVFAGHGPAEQRQFECGADLFFFFFVLGWVDLALYLVSLLIL